MGVPTARISDANFAKAMTPTERALGRELRSSAVRAAANLDLSSRDLHCPRFKPDGSILPPKSSSTGFKQAAVGSIPHESAILHPTKVCFSKQRGQLLQLYQHSITMGHLIALSD
jgi:hypothetical protein